jgi:uncharacterized protein YidB (DUF937 family)
MAMLAQDIEDMTLEGMTVRQIARATGLKLVDVAAYVSLVMPDEIDFLEQEEAQLAYAA